MFLKRFSTLFPFFRPYKKEIFFAFLALLVTAFTILFFGRAIKYLIDFGFVKQDKTLLNFVLLGFVAATIIMAIAGYFRSFLVNSVANKIIADLRKKTFAHLINLSPQFFENNKIGDIISRLTVDTILIQNIISNSASFFLRNSLFFIGGIGFLFFTSLKLSLLTFALIPLAISPIFILGKRVKKLSGKAQESLGLIGSYIEESISGIRTIQAYSSENKEANNFAEFVNKNLDISLKNIALRSLMVSLVIALAFGAIALILLVGGHDVLQQKMSAGDLSSFIFYAIITATALVSLSQIMGQIQTANAALERVFALLKIESEVIESKDLQAFPATTEITIKFENVSFSYPSRKDILVLDRFNLEIKPREKIAIVGASGAGKSTILQLLERFYDVDSGVITINGCDIKSLSFKDLRKNFSYIAQDAFIFSGTVFENIAYGENISEEVVNKLIAQNSAFEFINKLPQKIHSFVGQKGLQLSGGQAQRIALARAIIKDAPVLLLDEATSALDNENEQEIMKIIAELARDKIVIVVAHRLSTIENVDRIVELS